MSTRKKSNNFVQRLLKQIWRFFDFATKATFNRLLRSLLVSKRQSRLSNRAGFVLPTVVMMILVVTLLTTAIMIRSFDRSKNASNVRVDQAVLKAATPAIDRARAKIDRLFSQAEQDLEGNTPPDANIASILETGEYKLGDETQIQLTGEFPTDPLDTAARTLRTAWKFPVDTNNNGKFDTFTLYGIYFRSPQAKENRPRGTTEARALPQNVGQGDNCAGGGTGEESGWKSIGGQLKKAFFTYVANVPITDTTGLEAGKYEPYTGNKGFSALEMQLDQTRIALDNNAVWFNDDININSLPSLRLNGRVHTNSNLLASNPGGFPIEFLQVSSPESCFYQAENARIIVGGNFAAGDIGNTDDAGSNSVTVDLFRDGTRPNTQVLNNGRNTTTSGPAQVAGNSDAFSQRLDLLVQGAINIHDQDANVAGAPTEASVTALASGIPQEEDRKEFIEAFKKKFDPSNPGGGLSALTQTLETYFANRIRRVSLAEVPITAIPNPDAAITTASSGKLSAAPQPTDGGVFVFASGTLTPPPEWMTIEPPNTTTGLTLNINGGTMEMPATDPGTGSASTTRDEKEIGDRIIVGNNLPSRWLKPDGTFAKEKEEQDIPNVSWNGGGQRKRRGVAEQLDDLGNTSRNGFWETAAAKLPPLDTEELAGGLRVVTGAGIYVDGVRVAAGGTGRRMSGAAPVAGDRSFLPEPTLDSYYASAFDPTTGTYDPTKQAELTANLPPNPILVWPDSMPMYQWINRFNPTSRKPFTAPGIPEQLKGDLQMRATVVYHYKSGNDEPIACVSSYYDPTDPFTANNDPTGATGASNNGISYTPPATSRAPSPKLRRQSRMVFPDGRWANKPLYDAIANLDRGRELSLANKAAIDAANCALAILDGAAPGGVVPPGAIKEAAFLDARQIKAIHKVGKESFDATTPIVEETKVEDLNNPDHLKMASREELMAATETPLYTLPLEQRQPLEIRVTEIDLDALRRTAYSGDFLLPNSGIIYATRDDALPDLTATQTPANTRPIEIRAKNNQPSKAAATDFKLDPTSHPHGIRLINGSNLERSTTYKPEEKGLILASDLPVYVKGDFNLHRPSGTTSGTLEEFTQKLDEGAGFYERTDKDYRFACRAGAPTRCDTPGDQWRGARILSDAITLLSNSFRDGYRYEGDYDLRNNAGNLAVEPYLDNGFWMNSFATTAKWYDTNTGLPRTNFADDVAGAVTRPGSSYVMNGVTPIQRRVSFPVYKMEICKKLPASECSPQDWKGGSTPSTPSTLAGTTTASTPTPNFAAGSANEYASAHYPRRVAFEREPGFGQLVLEENSAATESNGVSARPIRPAGSVSYTSPPGPVNAQDNTLWFATTSVPSNPSAGLGFGNNTDRLYYAPDEVETPSATQPFVHERQLLLPGTPAFPDEFRVAANIANPVPFTGATRRTLLNGNTDADPSDFAVCTAANSSKSLTTTNVVPGRCPALTPSRQMLTALLNNLPTTPPAAGTDIEKVLSVTPPPADPTQPLTATASKKVNVIDIASLPANQPVTLNGGGQSDPIFIIRRTGALPLWRINEVPLTLNGVDPNNVFWITRTAIRISGSTTRLAGNFMGFGRLIIDKDVQINGGRFLGFATTVINAPITALTTTAQPLVVPVVQLHSPTGTPGGANNVPLQANWLQKATPTTFNAVFVMGDSPPRPLPSVGANAAESNGGLGNFPRFLEAWGDDINTNNQPAKISGGLYQLRRSSVASAPFETITNPATDTALFFDTPAQQQQLTGLISNFKYPGGSSANQAPYYIPPLRQWGYDVGLLSQTPDLFSRRFTPKETDAPNEFFREVARDDKWVKTLLCGTLADGSGNALPDAQRPTGCLP